jgi:hypothetical protein
MVVRCPAELKGEFAPICQSPNCRVAPGGAAPVSSESCGSGGVTKSPITLEVDVPANNASKSITIEVRLMCNKGAIDFCITLGDEFFM